MNNATIPNLLQVPAAYRPKPGPPKIELSEELEPCHDLVLLELIKTYKGLIHIPDSAKAQPYTCIVLKVGPGVQLEDGTRLPNCCAPGDRVFIEPHPGVGHKIEIDGRELILVGNKQILGVFKNHGTES